MSEESPIAPQQTRRRWLWGVAKQLSAGDMVEVHAVDTTRTLTVTQEARYVEQEPYRCNGLLISFEGYGTTYDIEIPDSDVYSCPKLLFSSAPATGYQVLDLAHAF